MNPSKHREYASKRARADMRAIAANAQLSKGTIICPTKGRQLTLLFGKHREYNTGVSRHHLGTDIANEISTPVHAGNHGIVTLTDKLHIYGNAAIINHGQDTSASYNHLNKIRVTHGKNVTKEQLIGSMGATGQAIGSTFTREWS